MSCKGKRLLILAGASVHLKLVETAQRMGVYTIVTDNVINSPAKRIADKAYDVDIFDVDGLEQICKIEKIDGIVSGYIDPCQRPYYDVCERLGYYCYGTQEQFYKLTDKHAFKQLCVDYGVGIIPEFKADAIDSIDYPVFVKPVDSRGSRGQNVCYNYNQLNNAIDEASCESSNGEIIIEKYMKYANEFQVTYFFVDGEPYLLRTCDSYCGSEKYNMSKVVACSVSPSRFTDSYLRNAHKSVINMLKSIGIKNGPVFMQGFEDNGVFRFFDPGRRFPGVDYERIYQRVFGINLMETMIYLALNGHCNIKSLPTNGVWLDGNRAAIMFPSVKAGRVASIKGIDRVINMNEVVSFLPRCSIGDTIAWSYNVNQRSSEIDLLANDTDSLKECIDTIQSEYRLFDENGNDMTLELFDTNRII